MWIRSTIASLAIASPVAVADAVTDLPSGEGRELVAKHCRTCHDLEEATKFRGYYGKDEWRDVILTMLTYDLVLPAGDFEAMVNYLAEQFGPEEAARDE
jgi:hypothetical protein